MISFILDSHILESDISTNYSVTTDLLKTKDILNKECECEFFVCVHGREKKGRKRERGEECSCRQIFKNRFSK